MPRLPKKGKSKRTIRKFSKKITKKPVSFDKKVLAVIHKQTEDKECYISNNESTLVSFNSAISGAGDILQIIPNMVNGTSINERVGDKVIVKSHNIYGYFRIVPNTGALNYKFGNVAVRQLVLSLKSISNYDAVVADPSLANKLLGLLRKGGTTVQFQGLVSDVMADINREVFTVHYDKVYHIKNDYNMSAVGATTQDTLRMFNINMKVKNKQLKYSDDMSAGVLPTNYGCFMAFGYAYMDGSVPDTVPTNLQVYYSSVMKYEDA